MSIDNLIDQFKTCSRLQVNGQLDVQDTKNHQWSFFYRQGRIVWATGGVHPVRRWHRQMTKHYPDVDVNSIQWQETGLGSDCWDYHVLTLLHKQQRLQLKQILAVVESTISEVFFDVSQQAVTSQLSYNRHQNYILYAPLTLSRTDLFLTPMQQSWQNWCDAGLQKLSPNLAPVLRRPDLLQKQASPRVYKNFVSLLTGKYTLRDLAVRMKQDVLQLTRSLIPYVKRGMVELVQVPDLPLPAIPEKPAPVAVQSKSEPRPLVFCVDDSPQVGQMLEKILTSSGFKFMSIQDSVQALPALIEHKPNLIFLDLMMPVVNGYELCAQVRRVSMFADTPIIILTGNDGIVDRVRAKVVGASDFMTKPVEAQKVLAVVRKYLRSTAPSRQASNFKLDQSADASL